MDELPAVAKSAILYKVDLCMAFVPKHLLGVPSICEAGVYSDLG